MLVLNKQRGHFYVAADGRHWTRLWWDNQYRDYELRGLYKADPNYNHYAEAPPATPGARTFEWAIGKKCHHGWGYAVYARPAGTFVEWDLVGFGQNSPCGGFDSSPGPLPAERPMVDLTTEPQAVAQSALRELQPDAVSSILPAPSSTDTASETQATLPVHTSPLGQLDWRFASSRSRSKYIVHYRFPSLAAMAPRPGVGTNPVPILVAGTGD